VIENNFILFYFSNRHILVLQINPFLLQFAYLYWIFCKCLLFQYIIENLFLECERMTEHSNKHVTSISIGEIDANQSMVRFFLTIRNWAVKLPVILTFNRKALIIKFNKIKPEFVCFFSIKKFSFQVAFEKKINQICFE
jgi:hypothetical protein